jgi:hypothetical protein
MDSARLLGAAGRSPAGVIARPVSNKNLLRMPLVAAGAKTGP